MEGLPIGRFCSREIRKPARLVSWSDNLLSDPKGEEEFKRDTNRYSL